jgi:type II secretory pathway pseudopilin PulG
MARATRRDNRVRPREDGPMSTPQMPPMHPQTPMMQMQQRTSGLAIAGFICAFLCSILGFVLSLLALGEINRGMGMVKGRGLAIAGIVISCGMFLVGVLGAVAIPAFVEYMKKSKQTEVHLQMHKLARDAKAFRGENGRFPVFDQELTPPASCCTQPNAQCQPENDNWNTDPWKAIDFEIAEPHRYRYGYRSDGETFDAIAVGDLDCDGDEATYTLHMTAQDAEAGRLPEPVPPARGVY